MADLHESQFLPTIILLLLYPHLFLYSTVLYIYTPYYCYNPYYSYNYNLIPYYCYTPIMSQFIFIQYNYETDLISKFKKRGLIVCFAV